MSKSIPIILKSTAALDIPAVLLDYQQDWIGLRSPRGVFPLGWLAGSAPAIGDLKSKVVVVGATSQRADLSPDDWAQVQPALDEGVLLEDGKGRVTIVRLLLDGGAVVIKTRSVAGVLHMAELRRLSATAAARDADVQRLGGRRRCADRVGATRGYLDRQTQFLTRV